MKKLAVLLLAACIAFSLVGCGSKELKDQYVTISEYKGVEIEKEDVTEVTDTDVDTEINSRLEAAATSTEVKDRAVQSGDTATIDYVGKKDGQEFEGGSATDYPLEIGSGTFIDGFEDGIIGHKTGETFDLNLTFPENYGNADLAGKPVVFTVTVKSIQQKNVPELNDEFVKENSEKSKTVDEYKKEVKEELEKKNKENFEASMKEKAWAEVMDNTEVTKYPEDKVDEMKEQYRSQYEQMASYYGVEFSEFLTQYMNMEEEEFEKQLDEAAKNSVKQELAADLIAKEMKLTPTDKEYEKIFEDYASQYGFTDVDAMKEQIGEDQLKEMAVQDKVLDWVFDNAKQVEAKEDDSDKDSGNDSKDEGKTDNSSDSSK